MEDGINKLKNLDVKKIAEKTHISINKLQAIINKDFTKLEKTTALGFVKILEREYSVDLSEWRTEYKKYIANIEENEPQKGQKYERDYDKSSKGKYIFGTIVVIGVLSYFVYQNLEKFTQNSFLEVKELEVKPIEDNTQEKVLKEEPITVISEIVSSNSVSSELNITHNLASHSSINSLSNNSSSSSSSSSISSSESSKKVENIDYIEPKKRVWVGKIYLDTFQKKDYTTGDRIELEENREQIIALGHGQLFIYINGNKKEYFGGDLVRFHYKNGEIKEITYDEFKALNRGKIW